jgi:hypothetical protein
LPAFSAVTASSAGAAWSTIAPHSAVTGCSWRPVVQALATILAPLTGLTGLTSLTILTVLACPAITTVAADGLTVNNFAIQDDWTTIGIEIHRASVADTTIASGRAGTTGKAVRTRLTGKTIFAI